MAEVDASWPDCINKHTQAQSSYKACPIFLIYFCFIMQEGLCSCSVFLLSIIYQCSSLSLRRDSAQESVQSRIKVIQVIHVDRTQKHMCLFVSWVVDKYKNWEYPMRHQRQYRGRRQITCGKLNGRSKEVLPFLLVKAKRCVIAVERTCALGERPWFKIHAAKVWKKCAEFCEDPSET